MISRKKERKRAQLITYHLPVTLWLFRWVCTQCGLDLFIHSDDHGQLWIWKTATIILYVNGLHSVTVLGLVVTWGGEWLIVQLGLAASWGLCRCPRVAAGVPRSTITLVFARSNPLVIDSRLKRPVEWKGVYRLLTTYQSSVIRNCEISSVYPWTESETVSGEANDKFECWIWLRKLNLPKQFMDILHRNVLIKLPSSFPPIV